jgi:hypothetical protein
MLYETQVFARLKHILKINTLQFQGGTKLYNRQSQEIITVDPIKLRTAVMEFKVGDGLVPTDKVIDADTLQVMMQMMATPGSPIAAQFDSASLMTYFLKTQGADVNEFKKPPQQIAFESAQQQWMQATQMMMSELQVVIKAAMPEQLTDLLKQIQQMLPPMPQPQQFGYNPNTNSSQGAPVSSDNTPSQSSLGSIMEGATPGGQ